MSTTLDPVLAALRVAGDEVQLTRVLAAVLATDPDVVAAFVELVMKHASQEKEIEPRARGIVLPEDLSCAAEQGLVRRGRGRVRSQAKRLGRADLYIAGTNFTMVCELKLDAPYRSDQLQHYLDSGAYVVALTRKPATRLSKRVRNHERWLGEICWQAIAPDLESLPVAAAVGRNWKALLKVITADEDFDPDANRRAAPADIRIAKAVATDALGRLAEAPRLRADRRTLLGRLEARSRKGARDGIAQIKIPRGDLFWIVRVRDAESRTPRVAVEWMPWEFPPREQRRMHRELEAKHEYRRRTSGGSPYYVRSAHIGLRPGEDAESRIADWVYKQIRLMVQLGLIDDDAKQL